MILLEIGAACFRFEGYSAMNMDYVFPWRHLCLLNSLILLLLIRYE